MSFSSHAPLQMDIVSASCYHDTLSLTMHQIQEISALNNMGIGCFEMDKLSDAGRFLICALDKINEMIYLSRYDNSHLQSKLDRSGISRSLYIFQREEYDEGMGTFGNPVRITANISFQGATAVILFNLGQVCIRFGEIEEAINFFLHSLSLLQDQSLKSRADEGVTILQILHNIGNMQYRRGMYQDAIGTYNRALHHAKSSTNRGTHSMLDLAATLNCLGVLHFHMPTADAGRALDLFYASLSIYRGVAGIDFESKEIATVLNNIGRVHYMTGKYTEAFEFYSESLAMRRRILGEDQLDCAATICNAGQTLHQQGKLNKAMEYYQEFLIIAKKRLSMNHRDVGVILRCMAQIFHELNDHKKAVQLYEEALTVGRKALGNVHPEYVLLPCMRCDTIFPLAVLFLTSSFFLQNCLYIEQAGESFI